MKNFQFSKIVSNLKSSRLLLMAFFALLIPVYLSAQVMQGIIEVANSWIPAILPIAVYLFTNIIKSRVKSEAKAINWLIYALTAMILTAAWGFMGFPVLSITEVIGSSTAIWGVVTTIKAFFSEKGLS